MFKFEGFTTLKKDYYVRSNVKDVVFHISLEAYAKISLDGDIGTCEISIATYLDSRLVNTKHKSYRILKYTFKNFIEMFYGNTWVEWNLTISLDVKGKSLHMICADFDRLSVLVRSQPPEDDGDSYGYSVFDLSKVPNVLTDKCYLHMSEGQNICIFFGGPKEPDYSVVIRDKNTFDSDVRKILSAFKRRVEGG